MEMGSAVSGANGFEFEVDAFGVDVTLVVAFGVAVTAFGVATAGAGVVTFGAVVVVGAGVITFGAVGVVTFGVAVVDDAAPAGTKPTKSAAAMATTLPTAPTAPSVVGRFRLKALLLLVVEQWSVEAPVEETAQRSSPTAQLPERRFSETARAARDGVRLSVAATPIIA
jgi:hypothetical protein